MRARAIVMKLGSSANFGRNASPKLMGMHWAAYKRLELEADSAFGQSMTPTFFRGYKTPNGNESSDAAYGSGYPIPRPPEALSTTSAGDHAFHIASMHLSWRACDEEERLDISMEPAHILLY